MNGDMIKMQLAVVVIAFLSLKSMAETLEGTEEHASPQACRATIQQYAKDTETWRKHEGTFKKATWRGSDSVKLEHTGMIETLTCKGKISYHKIESK